MEFGTWNRDSYRKRAYLFIPSLQLPEECKFVAFSFFSQFISLVSLLQSLQWFYEGERGRHNLISKHDRFHLHYHLIRGLQFNSYF